MMCQIETDVYRTPSGYTRGQGSHPESATKSRK